MKTILLILFLLATVCGAADTYTLYVVKSHEALFEEKVNQGHSLVLDNQEWLSILEGREAVVELFLQTEGSEITGKGTEQIYKMEYTDEWDESGNPKSTATREVGTRFHVIEQGNSILLEFQHTELERWIWGSPANPQWRPVFSTRKINTEFVLERGKTLVMGGLRSEGVNGETSQKRYHYILIERKE